MTIWIGHSALNIAIVLYLIHYLPQLLHNRRNEQLQAVNLHFHGILTISYLTDLSYGIGMQLPWQYRLVSLTGCLCLLVQHIQLRKIHIKAGVFRFYSLIAILATSLFYLNLKLPFGHNWYLITGYVAQGSALLYLLPVLFNNRRSQSANGLSPYYLVLNSLCYSCTMLAAFCLDWPLPSKLGSAFGLLCLIGLILQYWTYSPGRIQTVGSPSLKQ